MAGSSKKEHKRKRERDSDSGEERRSKKSSSSSKHHKKRERSPSVSSAEKHKKSHKKKEKKHSSKHSEKRPKTGSAAGADAVKQQLSDSDYFAKANEFCVWLVQHKGLRYQQTDLRSTFALVAAVLASYCRAISTISHVLLLESSQALRHKIHTYSSIVACTGSRI
jgi:hypothetical protein